MLFAFQLQRNAAKVVKVIRYALSEGAVQFAKINTRDFTEKILILKAENGPANFGNLL
jgi:hypothetical protein